MEQGNTLPREQYTTTRYYLNQFNLIPLHHTPFIQDLFLILSFNLRLGQFNNNQILKENYKMKLKLPWRIKK
jgi:hypothetical protein